MRSLALLVIVPRATARRTLINSRSAQREASARWRRAPLSRRGRQYPADGTTGQQKSRLAGPSPAHQVNRHGPARTATSSVRTPAEQDPAPASPKGCERSAAGLVPGVRVPPRRAAAPASNGRRRLAPIQLPSCFGRNPQHASVQLLAGFLLAVGSTHEDVPAGVEIWGWRRSLRRWSHIAGGCQLGAELVASFDEVGFDVDGELGEAAVTLDLAEAALGFEHPGSGPT
jgi:hypothetical protein